MVAKPAVYRKREKLGTKTAPFAASVSANFGGLGCVVVSFGSCNNNWSWWLYGVTLHYTIVIVMLLYRINC